jgi:spermidine synthase
MEERIWVMNLLNSLAADLEIYFTPFNLIVGFIACILAALMGTALAKKQAQTYAGQGRGESLMGTANDGHLPHVNYVDYGDMRFLHLGTPWVQGSMKLSQPFEIHLEYVQRMMGWLLFVELNQVSSLHAMQLGLGAASLTKFCHRHLGMRTTAIELNPQVIAACKLWFNLPEDTAQLQVVQADAAEVASSDQWRGKIDALQVDLYDQEAAYPVIDSDVFYANCRQLLTPDGCMTVNLYGRNANVAHSIQKIAHVFGKESLWTFKPTSAGNTIVLAFLRPRTLNKDALRSQAQAIQKRWPLPATKWLKTLSRFDTP